MDVMVKGIADSINIIVDGDIEVSNFRNFKQKLSSIDSNSNADIIIDLINMDYVSSYCLGSLLNLKKSQDKKGKKL